MLLNRSTSRRWVATVLGDLDAFLVDHAACERKASATAMGFVSHYPDRHELVEACVPLAREELGHFHDVYRWIRRRGLRLASDTRSAYMTELSRQFRQGSDAYFLDRLLVAAIAEARGCERFALLAAALPDPELADFYRELARSEARHQDLYRNLASVYFDEPEVSQRLGMLLESEAEVIAKLPIRPTLY